MSSPEKFWDRIANRYERTPIKDKEAFLNKIDNIKKYLATKDTVLDYACGTGTYSNAIAGSVKEVHAIDISSKMLAHAIEKADSLGLDNIKHSRTTIFDGGLEKDSFDAIIALNIIHLSEDIQEVIQRINELLKPDGILISSTPCVKKRWSLIGVLNFILGKLGIVPNLKMPLFQELESTFKDNHFEIVESEEKSIDYFIIAKKLLH